MIAVLIGCGLRRAEAAALKLEDIQLREGHWVIADLNGKGGHIRTVPMPDWVKRAIDEWTVSAGLTSGPLFRAINKAGRTWGNGFTPKVIWSIVREGAANCGLTGLAPHDLRRTCARLCHQAGGELEQIQFLLGHVSIETTERYLGCKQRFSKCGERCHRTRTQRLMSLRSSLPHRRLSRTYLPVDERLGDSSLDESHSLPDARLENSCTSILIDGLLNLLQPVSPQSPLP